MIINRWEDNCLGHGFIVTILAILPILGLLVGFVCSFKLIFAYGLNIADSITPFLGCLFLGAGIYILTDFIKIELNTIQKVILLSGRINGTCHYNKNFTIEFNEIKSISDLHLNFSMKQMRLFQAPSKGFDILLHCGKLYHVSPHMSNIASLKHVLLEGMARRIAL